jgi:hypothetical protein
MGKKDFPWLPRQMVRLVCWLVFALGRSQVLAVLFRPLSAAVLRRYRSGLHGKFPGAVTKGVLFLSCDEAYYQEFGTHLVSSALKHAPGFNIHLHVNRLSQSYRQELQRFADHQSGGAFSYTWDDLEFEHLSGARRWYYLASVRFVRLYQLVQTCRAPVLSLDADGLVVKSLDSKFAQLTDHDAGIYLRLDNTLDWRKVLASALFVMPTELGQRFSRDVAVVIAWLLRGRLHYHIDQLVIYYLWDLYRSRQPGFTVVGLAQDMADWECGQGSYIWSAKGERKYLDEQFLKARQQ